MSSQVYCQGKCRHFDGRTDDSTHFYKNGRVYCPTCARHFKRSKATLNQHRFCVCCGTRVRQRGVSE